MKIPEAAPTGALSPAFLEDLAGTTQMLAPVLRKAQQEYLYWDKFKHLRMPDSVSPQDAWRFVKLMRSLNRQPTPIRDGRGDTFTYEVTEEVLRGLHNIDKWAGGWEPGTLEELPGESQKERYIISSLVEEAIASSQIEGASTTRRRGRAMILNAEKPRDHSERMIMNNYLTMKRIGSLRNEPITPELIIGLQASMTEDTLEHPEDVGALRCTNDVVVADETNNILYTPPPCEQIEELLNNLCDYANDESAGFQHPVIKAIALHFWLALIHPFADGNGRTARALFYLYMLKKGYWLFEYLSISRVILKRRAQYERAYLYAEIDGCDFTYFLLFNLRAIETSLTDMRTYVERKSREDVQIQKRIQGAFDLNYRQRAVLSRALKKPDAAFTFQSHATSHGVVRATARADLLELEEAGYLTRRREGRAFVFVAAKDLRVRIAALEE